MKTTAIVLGVLVILVGAFFALNAYIYEEKQAVTGTDHKNAEYLIEGERILLKDGVAEAELAPGSASKKITRYFGNEVVTDLNGDGRDDVVFLLTQELGGSGTFYYVVAALNTEKGYRGSEAVLLGDRIAPQTTELSQNPNHKQVVVVNYADRASGEPMTTPPSVGKSMYLKLDPEALQFGIVEPDFEGEADPDRMSLTMKTWNWVSASYRDGREITPLKPGVFSLTFGADGKVTIATDCNSMGGTYTSDDTALTFSDLFSTKMYCEGSQEQEFAEMLTNTSHYHFTSRGQLILDLKFDSGTVEFI